MLFSIIVKALFLKIRQNFYSWRKKYLKEFEIVVAEKNEGTSNEHYEDFPQYW
jgi:hypothetical protein